jgi:hypothetical protein
LPVGDRVHHFEIHTLSGDDKVTYDYDLYVLWSFLATTLPVMRQLRSLKLTHPRVVPKYLISLKDMSHLHHLSITVGRNAQGVITFLNQLTQLTELSINVLGKKNWLLWPTDDYLFEPPLAMPNLRTLRWRDDEFQVCDEWNTDQTFHFLGACRIHPTAAIDIEIRWSEDSHISDMLPFFRAHKISKARLNFTREEYSMASIADELLQIPVLDLTAHFSHPQTFFARRQLPADLHFRVLSPSSGNIDDLLELLAILADNGRPVQSQSTRLHLWYDNTLDDWIETARLDYEREFREHTLKLNALNIEVIYEGPVDAEELALHLYMRTRC